MQASTIPAGLDAVFFFTDETDDVHGSSLDATNVFYSLLCKSLSRTTVFLLLTVSFSGAVHSLLSLACYCKVHLLLALKIPVNDPLSQLSSPVRVHFQSF